MTHSVRYLLLFCFVAVFIGGMWVWGMPAIISGNAPQFLNTKMAPFLHVESATFTRSPPELVLHRVRVKDPAGYNNNDALRIDRVHVRFHGYSVAPLRIANLTFVNVRGEYKIRDDANNFSILFDQLMARKIEPAQGLMARQAVLERLTIDGSSVQNEDASAYLPLADKELVPTGALKNAVPLQYLIADSLGAVILHERETADLLKLQEIKEKTKGIVRSIGDSVMDYLNKP